MLRINLRPSWLLAGVLTLAHAAAIAGVLIVSMPPWVKFVATAMISGQCLMAVWRQALLLGPHGVLALEITADDAINIHTRASGWSDYDVIGSTYVTPYLTILNLRRHDHRGTRHIVLMPDSLHAEDFRKLRVWLRWKEDRVKS